MAIKATPLQLSAERLWAKGKPLTTAQWKRLAERGLYDWAKYRQLSALRAARYPGEPVVPAFSELGLPPENTKAVELWGWLLSSLRNEGLTYPASQLEMLVPQTFNASTSVLRMGCHDLFFRDFVEENYANLLAQLEQKEHLRIEIVAIAKTEGGDGQTETLEAILSEQAAPAAAEATEVSSKKLNTQRRLVAASLQRQEKKQDLGYTPSEFVMFSIPQQPLKSGANTFERVNGNYSLTLRTWAPHQVPYGQDRLLPIWLATAYKAAGQPDDGIIRFRSCADILRTFGQDPDAGSSRRLLRERMLRWLYTELKVEPLPGVNPSTSMNGRIRAGAFKLYEAVDLWFDTGSGSRDDQLSLWQNKIQLSRSFTAGLRDAAIPIDLASVVALKDKPSALDLYVWQAHRSWEKAQSANSSPTVIPLASLSNQLGSMTKDPRKQLQQLRKAQECVQAVWKACPNYIDTKRNLFFLYPGTAVLQGGELNLAGVLKNPPVKDANLSGDAPGRLRLTATPSP